MSSSRALIRALNTVFDYWDSSDAPIQTSELFKTITAFNEKHNSLQSIKQSANIHGELYNFYNTQIKPSSNLPHEILFLEILTELSPVLSEDEVLLWLKTYLRPAVDSASFDVKFVGKCRNFVSKVCVNYSPTDDPDLTDRRTAIATACIKKVLDLLFGLKKPVYEEFGIHIDDEHKLSQVDYERFRFIKRNASAMLREFALEHPTLFAELANVHFVKADERLDVLSLLTSVVTSRSSKLHDLVYTDLFRNLFRCLSYDFDERVLSVCSSLLVMLVPLISENVSAYLSDILAILSRIALWYDFKTSIPDRVQILKQKFVANNDPWDIAENEVSSNAEFVPFSAKFDLDPTYLATIIYGLFPCSFTYFAQGPNLFLRKHPPKLLESRQIVMNDSRLLNEVEVGPKDSTPLENVLKRKCSMYLKSFRFHPNFLSPEKWSTEYECKHPTTWLIEENKGDSLGSEEIMIGCFNLNPELAVNIPEYLRGFELNKVGSTASSMNPSGLGKPTSRTNNLLWGEKGGDFYSPHQSRHSSVGGPLYFNFADQMHAALPNSSVFNRKLSIIPTNLIIDNKAPNEITFKEVNYEKHDDNKTNSNNSLNARSPSMKSTDEKANDPIKDLFLTHEKLFGPLTSVTSTEKLEESRDSSIVSDKITNNVRSFPTIESVEAASEKRDKNSDSAPNLTSSETATLTSTKPQPPVGTVVDFFHRELLLMKNEVEFTSYMKHLSKFQYVKLKLQMNRMLQDAERSSNSLELANLRAKVESAAVNSRELQETVDSLRTELNKLKEESFKEKTLLAERCVQLSERCKVVQFELQEITSQKQALANDHKNVVSEVIPRKDQEISVLTADLYAAQQSCQALEAELRSSKVETKKEEPEHNPKIEEYEKSIFKMTNEIQIYADTTNQLRDENAQLRAKYENAEMNFEQELIKARESASAQIRGFTYQNEKKIQELNAAILKYESVIEEKNLRIAQSSVSRPISIPGSISVNSDYGLRSRPEIKHTSTFSTTNPGEMYEDRDRSNSSVESSGVNFTPLPKTNTMPIPIIKGRGGYQKRSKKLM